MKRFFSLKKDGKFLPYFRTGTLSKLPVVYDSKRVANAKAKMFGAEVVPVSPTHQLVDENGNPYLYIINESLLEKYKSKLNIADGHEIEQVFYIF